MVEFSLKTNLKHFFFLNGNSDLISNKMAKTPIFNVVITINDNGIIIGD